VVWRNKTIGFVEDNRVHDGVFPRDFWAARMILDFGFAILDWTSQGNRRRKAFDITPAIAQFISATASWLTDVQKL
jgi:hypothetical protein